MPSALRGTTYKHPSFKNVSLFAQPIKGSDTINWYTRVTFPKKVQSVRSLKLPYIPNDAKNKAEAEQKATEIYYELDKRHQQGLSNKQTTIVKLIDRFLKETEQKTQENMASNNAGKSAPHILDGGKTPLNQEKFEQLKWVMREIIQPYFQLKDNKHKTLDALQKGRLAMSESFSFFFKSLHQMSPKADNELALF